MMTVPKIQKIEIAKLTWDPQIYPRVDVSTHHVSEIVEALRAGAKVPPITVEEKGLRIVDGVHRWRAYKIAFGTEAKIEAALRTYADERALFLDAVKLNADHGLPYSSFERTRNILRGQELGIATKEIARALHIRFDKAERLTKDGTAIGHLGTKPQPVALKRSLRWLGPGSTLTDDQLKMNESAGGMPPLYYINQLISMLESGLWTKGGEPVQAGLRKLYAALGKVVVKEQKTA